MKLEDGIIDWASDLVSKGHSIEEAAVIMKRSYRSVACMIYTHTVGVRRLRQQYDKWKIREALFAILDNKETYSGDKLEEIIRRFEVKNK